MAVDFLSYSPTYQATVRPSVRERRASLIPYLTERYAPKEQRKLIIARIRNMQEPAQKGNSPERYYGDFKIWKEVYEKYLAASEEERREIIDLAETDHANKADRNEFLHVVWCLAQDGIRTMDDVVRLNVRNAAADSPPPPELDAHAETAEKESIILRAEDLPEIHTKEGNERIAAVCALLSPVKDLFMELIRENMAFKEEIAKIGRERAFLNRLLAEYRARLAGAIVMDEKFLAGAEEIARELDNTAWAQTNRLPLQTSPEKWHNQNMEIIYGPTMRENFESKHLAGERKRIREHVNLYAQQGRGHNSFYTKVFDTQKGDQRLAGVPEDTTRYWYHRVSDGMRFYAEIKGGKLFIYNIEPRESIS